MTEDMFEIAKPWEDCFEENSSIIKKTGMLGLRRLLIYLNFLTEKKT